MISPAETKDAEEGGARGTMSRWENTCRLCAEERSEMLSIFGSEGLQRKVAQKLRACLPVLVYKTDPLPKQICQFCAARLDDAYEFREYCLSVYRSMHRELLACKNVEAVQIFFDAMKSSPDPCQAQLCAEKVRAPPPLVPLPSSLPIESPSSLDSSQEHPNNCIETLTELPCEVEIKEVSSEPILANDTVVHDFEAKVEDESYKEDSQCNDKEARKEEKRTSILEQVLTGNLTMNDRKELKPKAKLSSKWWCAPCNNYYKTRESLVKHMQFDCPRKYTCRKCCQSFELVEDLAKHEATSHLKVTLNFDETIKDCHQCDRQFVSWEMLKQHRLRDHLAASVETNTWCSLCNRFFPSVETYHNHIQLHETDDDALSTSAEDFTVPKMEEAPKISEEQEKIKVEPERKRENRHELSENTKSLTCHICGKVCTQPSALSNHMRTHEPKRHKCDVCGRSFGLFIRLATHRLTEHGQQSVPASIEQEEALNAEREAREAREIRVRTGKSRSYSEMVGSVDGASEESPPTKRNASFKLNTFKNVIRCGICLQWFNDNATMLAHLQTHSDNYSYKTFTCQICRKSFKEKWQLLRHEQVSHRHNDSTASFTCTVCNKSFEDKTVFKAHQKTHVVDRTYHCPKCNKIFFKEVSLLTHQCTSETFMNKKPTFSKPGQPSVAGNRKGHKCLKCNTTFKTPQARSSHMKYVHPEDPEVVQKHETNQTREVESDDESMPKLSPETSLEYSVPPIEPKVEISEETAPPPIKRTLIRTTGGYRCGVCQSPFVLRELAVAHLRSAHPIMPYQCPYCKKRFTTQYSFTHHIKTDHPEEPDK